MKPGYARNFLLPQKKALRANKANLAQFEGQRAQLEAQNLKRREEAERLSERMAGLSVVIIRQAGESGSLYGSVSARDISDACTAAGLTTNRNQVVLDQPIKTLGLTAVKLVLHPEVSLPITVNVARSTEEAEKQARGEQVGRWGAVPAEEAVQVAGGGVARLAGVDDDNRPALPAELQGGGEAGRRSADHRDVAVREQPVAHHLGQRRRQGGHHAPRLRHP